jgi:hypothetical protein
MQKRIVALTKKPENDTRRNYSNKMNTEKKPSSHGVLYISLKMLVGSLITCTSLSFCLGRWTRSILTMMKMNAQPVDTSTASANRRINKIDNNVADDSCISYGRSSYQHHLDNNASSFLVDFTTVDDDSSSVSLHHLNSSNSASRPPYGPYGRTSNHLHRRLFMLDQQRTTTVQCSSVDHDEQEESILFHEALIHPAMLTHPNPRRVLLILVSTTSDMKDVHVDVAIRQIFQHNTVQHVTVLIQHSDSRSSSSSSSSSSTRTSSYSFDDDDDDNRVEVIHEDAVDFFQNKELLEEDAAVSEKYDVIILDSPSKRHYHHTSIPMFSSNQQFDDDDDGDDDDGNDDDDDDDEVVFAKALGNALTRQGILVVHAGSLDKGRDAPLDCNPKHRRERAAMTRALEQLGELEVLDAVKIYTQSSSSLSSLRRRSPSSWHTGGGWTFMIAFREYTTLTRWFANQAEIDLQLAARTIMSTAFTATSAEDADETSSFRYFDGATMESYQYPSRIVQDVFCRSAAISPDTPDLCAKGHGFDPIVPNAPISSFEVRPSNIEGAGRGVFLKESVQQGTYIAIDHGVHSILVMPNTNDLVTEMQDQTDSSDSHSTSSYGDLWNPLLYYMHGYGFDTDYFGDDGTVVDSGILTFTNHGCNGTYNMGQSLSSHEMTALDASGNIQPPLELLQDDKHTIYDVFYDRSHWIYESGSDVMRVDVAAGSELLDNYLPFYVDWEEGVEDLRSQCQGQAVGLVTAYETAESNSRL